MPARASRLRMIALCGVPTLFMPPVVAAQTTTDAITQQAYAKASNTDAEDQFGFAVAVSGDLMVVGAPRERSSSTGVDGDQGNAINEAGAVYIYRRRGATWTQDAYLKASNTGRRDHFGYSVAISGETVVVGAPEEDSHATGVNGDQGNDSHGTGAAYVFVRTDVGWQQQAYLKATNTRSGAAFGRSVAIWENTIVVGAPQEAGSASGVNGNQSAQNAFYSGAAYVFVRSGTNWTREAYLKASNNCGYFCFFGWSVAAWGDRILVGAIGERSAATGVNGDQHDTSSFEAGAAYLFVRDGSTWTQEAYLKASNTEARDVFGWSVGLSDRVAVVGAPRERGNATGVNGDQTDNSLMYAGAAYTFLRADTGWIPGAYLKPTDIDEYDSFGYGVAVSGETVLVGAYGEAGGSIGVNGNPGDNGLPFSGAASLFQRRGSSWVRAAYLKSSNADAGDYFGYSVALSGDTMVVSALWEASSATGVDGDQSVNDATLAGAAYVFETPIGTRYCIAAMNSAGLESHISLRGSRHVGENDLTVFATDAPADRAGLFLYSDTQAQVPFGNGFRCLGNPRRLDPPTRTDSSGYAELRLDFSVDPLLSDIALTLPGQWNFQFWYRDRTAGSAGHNLSDGFAVEFVD